MTTGTAWAEDGGWRRLRGRRLLRADQGLQGRGGEAQGQGEGWLSAQVLPSPSLIWGQEDFQGEHCPLVQKERYCRPAHACPGARPSAQG